MTRPGELRPQVMKGNFHTQIRWTYELVTESHFGKLCLFFFPEIRVLFTQRSDPGALIKQF